MGDRAIPAVVYLARWADGIAAFQRFATSYKAHSPAMSHDMVVIYKGFRQSADLREAKKVFEAIQHRALELPDTGFDIGAYFECAKHVPNPYLVFLNSHTEIATDGWLAALARHGSQEQVGVAAAMGSFESLQDTVEILSDVIWRCIGVGEGYDQDVAHYFDFLLKRFHPNWYSTTGSVLPPKRGKAGYRRKLVRQTARLLRRPWFAVRGTTLIWPGAPRFDVSQFPRFPNPHIRSNGFMIRRDRWLQFQFTPSRKIDANLFESGPQSLTRRLRESGLATLVVGADGNGYDVPDWPRSRTFRIEDQANLLVRDNHTRAFEEMSEGARVAHAWMTWGNDINRLPPDFPDLGFALRSDFSGKVRS